MATTTAHTVSKAATDLAVGDYVHFHLWDVSRYAGTITKVMGKRPKNRAYEVEVDKGVSVIVGHEDIDSLGH